MPDANTLARDVMQTELVTIGPKESLQEAMALLMDSHISGLPVLDAHDRCVGVISATDILSLEYEHTESAESEEVGSYFNSDSQRWENLRFTGMSEQWPEMSVQDAMTTDIVAVRPNAKLRDVAALCLERGVHRVLVVDEQQRLHGLISALDLVRVVAES